MLQQGRVVWDATNSNFCNSGYDTFSDIAVGTAVTIYDGANAVIGVSSLAGGKFVKTGTTAHFETGAQVPEGHCEFAFEVAGLRDADFYAVEVGRRGRVNKSRADLVAAGWTAVLSL